MNLEHLNDHPLLRYLTEEEISLVRSACIKKIYEPGDILIDLGQRNRDIISLDEGSVSIQIETLGGMLTEVAQTHQGNVIGEMNFVIPTRRTANVIALTKVRTTIFPYQELTQLLNRQNTIAYKIFAAINLSLAEKYITMLQDPDGE